MEYLWAGVEMKSPALEFKLENLRIIEEVCQLITKKYLTTVNQSCGLHVHISAGLETAFQFKTLKNLFALIYAFEPQLDTLHPPHRQNNRGYCTSLRQFSNFVDEFMNEHWLMPTVAEGLADLLEKQSLKELLHAVAKNKKPMTIRHDTT